MTKVPTPSAEWRVSPAMETNHLLSLHAVINQWLTTEMEPRRGTLAWPMTTEELAWFMALAAAAVLHGFQNTLYALEQASWEKHLAREE